MERVYVLNRIGKWLCWFEMAYCAALAAFFVGIVVHGMHRWVLGQYADRPYVPVLAIPFFIAGVAVCMLWIRASLRKLRYSVIVDDDAITINRDVIPWEWIDRIDHLPASITRSFSIHTWKGRAYSILAVEHASQLEDMLRARLLSSERNMVWDSHVIHYEFPSKCKLRLTVLYVLLGVAAWVCCFGIFISPGGMLLRPFYVVGFLPLYFLAERASKFTSSDVAVYDGAIRIGDVVMLWNEVDGIEHSKKAGVAFIVRMQDGKKLNVYSGLENVRGLEDIIKERMSGAATD